MSFCGGAASIGRTSGRFASSLEAALYPIAIRAG
jgi:hypothetical protein